MSLSSPILHGISNCDAVKKARAFLDARAVAYRFIDLRRDGVSTEELQRWLTVLGADALINRRGTTWRQLDASQQALAHSIDGALHLMQTQPSVIKRPVVDWGDTLTVGFDAQDWEHRVSRM